MLANKHNTYAYLILLLVLFANKKRQNTEKKLEPSTQPLRVKLTSIHSFIFRFYGIFSSEICIANSEANDTLALYIRFYDFQ